MIFLISDAFCNEAYSLLCIASPNRTRCILCLNNTTYTDPVSSIQSTTRENRISSKWICFLILLSYVVWTKIKHDYIIHCLNWFNFRVKFTLTPGKMHNLWLSQAHRDSLVKCGTSSKEFSLFFPLSHLVDDACCISDVTALLLLQHSGLFLKLCWWFCAISFGPCDKKQTLIGGWWGFGL